MQHDPNTARRTLGWSILLIPLVLLVTLGLYSLALALFGEEGTDSIETFLESTPGFLLGLFLNQLGLLLVLGMVMAREAPPWSERLGLRRGLPGALDGALLGRMACATIGVTLIAGLVSIPLVEIDDTYTETIQEGISGATGAWIPLVVFGMAVLPAVIEELLFRGFLLRGLLLGYRPALAIGVSSLVFAIAHLNAVHALRLLPLAVWLGWLTWRTNTIVPAMVCHFANNLLAVAGFLAATNVDVDPGAVENGAEPPLWSLLFLLPLLAGFVYCLVCIRTVIVRLNALAAGKEEA